MCPLCGELMGKTAETLAERYEISRDEQDRYAVETQRRCASEPIRPVHGTNRTVADDDFVDAAWFQSGRVQRGTNRMRAEFGRRQRGEFPLEPANRRTRCGENEHVVHGLSFFGKMFGRLSGEF